MSRDALRLRACCCDLTAALFVRLCYFEALLEMCLRACLPSAVCHLFAQVCASRQFSSTALRSKAVSVRVSISRWLVCLGIPKPTFMHVRAHIGCVPLNRFFHHAGVCFCLSARREKNWYHPCQAYQMSLLGVWSFVR